VTKLKWILDSVCLELVLILTQDSCMVYAKRTTGSAIVLDAPKVMKLKWKLDSDRSKIVQILKQDRCMVCAECTIASEVILDAPDGTPW
jgi:predicted transcriptional regulator